MHDLRDWATDRHRSVDDESFGGGPGMVLKPEPLFAAVESLDPDRGRVLACHPPAGASIKPGAAELATEAHLTLLCGRYEGVDERVMEGVPAEEVSIGDYVVSGGELPALVLIEAVTRLVPGVIGNEASRRTDSFSEPGLLDHPHTRGRRSSAACGFPTCCSPVTTRRSTHGGATAAQTKTARNRPDLRRQPKG